MITPGPVVITVAFIGYLVAGLAGSLAAALARVIERPGMDQPVLGIGGAGLGPAPPELGKHLGTRP